MAGVRETWVRSFTVTDPTTHEKGFTVYKVTYKAFPLSRPEETVEVIVWKRYNDFKKLHKALAALHFNLRRPEKFPEFARSKIFGRFEDGVIEERRKSALNLLEFTSKVPVLARSQLMNNFFKGGEEVIKKKIAEPPILQPSNIQIPTEPRADTSAGDSAPSDMASVSDGSVHSPGNEAAEESTILGGVWLHRQDEDILDEESGGVDYVYEGSDDERTTFSEDSLPSTPLPTLQDISVFDPLADNDVPDGPQPPTLHTSNSWLFHAMDLCADLKGDSPDQSEESSLANSSTDLSADSGITLKLPAVPDHSPFDDPSSEPAVLPVSQDLGFSTTSSNQGPSRDKRSSMAQAYLRCIKAQEAADRDAKLDVNSGIVDSREETPNPSPQHGESRARSVSGDSISKLVVRGEHDYLFKAAQAIGQALQNEANGFYQAAFDSYKAGVSILLNGVAGETNKLRREAVRKKTAQYLMRAEDVYNSYLSDMDNSKRWELETLAVESDPSSEHLRGSTDELKKYKVLGVIDRVMLVLDMTSYQTFVIKVLNKCPVTDDKVRTCIPSYCPYMVRLSRFIESDSSIYLVLEHASGGKLWEYVSSYLNQDEVDSQKLSPSGHKVLGTRSQSPQSPRVKSFAEDESRLYKSSNDSERTKGTSHTTTEPSENEMIGAKGHVSELSKKEKEDKTDTRKDQTWEIHSDYRTSEEANNSDDNLVGLPKCGSKGVHDDTEAGPHLDEKITWIASSPDGSGDSAEGMLVIPGVLLPKGGGPLGNGSGEFDIIEEGESLNYLVEQSCGYDDGVKGQEKSREGEDTNPAGARFSLFSIDSTEESQNVAPGSDGHVLGSSEGVPNGGFHVADVHNRYLDTVSSEQDAKAVISDALDVIEKVNRIVDDGDHIQSEKFKLGDTSGFAVKSNEDNRIMNTNAGVLRTLDSEPGNGNEVFLEGSPHHEPRHGLSGERGQENDCGRIVEKDATVLTPSRKRSSKWDEFFKLNESEEGQGVENGRTKIGDATTENIKVVGNKFGQERDGFNVCVNPFEVNPHGLTVGQGQTCVTVDNPDQPRRTSVEVIKEWPSSPTNSPVSTPSRQLKDNKADGKSRNASGEQVSEGNSRVFSVMDKISSDDNQHEQKSKQTAGMIANANNPHVGIVADSTNANKQLANTDSKSNESPQTRNSRLPSLSTLFSHLDDIRKKQGVVHLPESCICIWAAEIAVALSSLHACGIICRDLNPANVLLAQGGHIRLTYFSHWKCIKPIISAFAIENSFVAPEVFGLQPVTPACDWWSYGVLLFELLTGRSLHSCHPCGVSTHTELLFPNHLSSEGRSLLKQLIQPVPHERLGSGRSGVEEIKAHPFFADVDWSSLRG